MLDRFLSLVDIGKSKTMDKLSHHLERLRKSEKLPELHNTLMQKRASNLEALLLYGAGTKSRTRDPLITSPSYNCFLLFGIVRYNGSSPLFISTF